MKDTKELEKLAKEIRHNILDMIHHGGVEGGHLGGSFSCADVLAVLYGSVMNVLPETTNETNRDRFILSKGHVAVAHYATLAAVGFITKEEMMTFEDSGGNFSTHEVINVSKGIETSNGSLGYGLSIGIGCALAAKMDCKSYNTYVLIGDGESNEGSIWEAAMAAARFKLDNLVAIIDFNGQCSDGYIKDIMPVNNYKEVFEGFGWNAIEIDGNNVEQIIEALNSKAEGKPTAIIAKTAKAKGIPSIEGKLGWHHVRITDEQYLELAKELEEA